jgi:hypothetical protein
VKRTLLALFLLALVAAVLATALTLPASAQPHRVTVVMPDGTRQQVVLDLQTGVQLQDVRALVPGEPVLIEPLGDGASTQQPGPPPAGPQTPTPPPPAAPEQPPATQPESPGGESQRPSADRRKAKRKRDRDERRSEKPKPRSKVEKSPKRRPRPRPTPLRNPDGSPTRRNPGLMDGLPGPSTATGVPNFVIRKFRVPIFLLPIYQAAGIQYGIRWEILAAINEIETDYGRNLNVSSAGALGWMQFMPSTWEMYGTDANKDGREDPYNPVDAIFAAARYLKAAGYEDDPRRAVFAYNHADWYVDSVLLRARLISGVPADLVGSLTGLTEGRFPVYARARYADDLHEREALKKVKRGQNAANVVESKDDRRGVEIFARRGAPAVAVNDGVVKKIGRSKKHGRYVVVQDVYGNRYMYGRLGSVARYHPVPSDGTRRGRPARAIHAHGRGAPRASAPLKSRLFANPDNDLTRDHGGPEQVAEHRARREGGFEVFNNQFSRPFGSGEGNIRMRRLRKGSRVVGGTILGRLGPTTPGKAAHLYFEIRPAGRGAPRIDPKPILDGWKLLEATAVYRSSGRNVLHGKENLSIGQIMMMPKPMLAKRVLGDERIETYDCGRQDIRSGQVDRRVLATLEYLAETGFRPTVTSLKCGHSFYTTGGGVSHHSSGNALDIAKVNGVPILGHQEPGGITEQTVRQLMRLQGTMRPDQIISLLDLGQNTLAMGDHADHIHVGFRPRFGENRKLGRQALAVLKPGQWSDLLSRLRRIENPAVPTKPSRYSLPARRDRRKRPRAEASRRLLKVRTKLVRRANAPVRAARPARRLRPVGADRTAQMLTDSARPLRPLSSLAR